MWPEFYNGQNYYDQLQTRLCEETRALQSLKEQQEKIQLASASKLDDLRKRHIELIRPINDALKTQRRIMEKNLADIRLELQSLEKSRVVFAPLSAFTVSNRLPDHLSKLLYNYQAALVHRMLYITENHPDDNMTGNLGNAVGTGKTRVALIFAVFRALQNKKTLIIVPQRMFDHWLSEWNLLSSELKDVDISFYRDVRGLRKSSSTTVSDIVVIGQTTYSQYHKEFWPLYYHPDRVVIFDEMNTFDHLQPQSRKWIISATIEPRDVVRRYFGFDTTAAAATEFIIKEAVIPPLKFSKIFCRGIEERIRSLLPGHTLELINQGDYRGAILSVGGASTHKNVLHALTDDLKNNLETLRKKLEAEELSENAKASLKVKIRDTEDKLADYISRLENASCPICLTDEDQVMPVFTNCCKQRMCLECLLLHLGRSPTCAFCRSRIKSGDDFTVMNDVEVVDHQGIPRGSKLDALKNLVLQNEGAKVLVFSDNHDTFNVRSELLQFNIESRVLQGSSAQSRNTINDHADGKFPVLFINRVVCGEGIHLAHADIIVFFHNQRDGKGYTQAIGRANRLPRKTSLQVIELLANNEVSCAEAGGF